MLTTVVLSTASAQPKADSLLRATFEKSNAMGIMAGYTSSESSWNSAVGLKNESEPLSIDTKIRIASIAKTMTAVAIMQLVEEGKIDLDIGIKEYYPDASEQHLAITVRQLLSHSSGIRAYKSSKERENMIEYAKLKDAYSIIKDDELIAQPGERFSYTSYGYVLLGIIVEQVSGLSYETYLQNNIWEPLSMNQTGIERESATVNNLSQLYHRSRNGKVKTVKKRTNLSDRIPGGGVYSTAIDVLKFGDGLVNNKLISESSFALMTTDTGMKKQGNAYGLGLYLYGKNPRYGNVVGHSGTQTGASAQLMLLTDLKAVVFVASNTSGVWEDIFYLNVQLFSEAER